MSSQNNIINSVGASGAQKIYDIVTEGAGKTVYTSSLFGKMLLKTKLTADMVKKYLADKQMDAERRKALGFMDSDGDGVDDALEIAMELLKVNGDKIVFPCFGDVSNKNSFVSKGIDTFSEKTNVDSEIIKSTLYLPQKQAVNNPDTDGDGLLDDKDPNPLSKDVFIDFGSSEYMSDLISRFEKSNYYINTYPRDPMKLYISSDKEPEGYYDELIKLMMKDVDNSTTYSLVSDDNWDSFCEFFNYCITQYSNIDRDRHYFRNKLNRAPDTLSDMIVEYNDWVLCDVDDSAYHMFGSNGGYNLKFISKCGKYEAVYNFNGELLTENVDPLNMGTYNYANYMKSKWNHANCDVVPYEFYGNSSSSHHKLFPSTKEYDSNTNAQNYRKDMIDLLDKEIDSTTKISEYKKILVQYSG